MKTVGIVFFCDLKCINWNEETNTQLSEILETLDMKLGKSVGHEVTLKPNGLPEIKILERPAFSNDIQSIDLTFMDNRMEFKFKTEDKTLTDKIGKYFEYLETITKKLKLKIERLGINCAKKVINNLDLSKYYIPLDIKEPVVEFGLKQNIIQKIFEDNVFSPEMNVLVLIEENNKDTTELLVDINTIPNGKNLEEDVRKKFLMKTLDQIDILLEKLDKI